MRYVSLIVVIGLMMGSLQARNLDKVPPCEKVAYPLDWKRHTIGKLWLVLTNMGTIGGAWEAGYSGLHAEFPPGSLEEHLCGAGVWIGAIVEGEPYVTTGYEGWAGPWFECYPTQNEWDTIWVVETADTFYDIPYWTPYVKVSAQDFVARYFDNTRLDIPYHHPLNIEIIQRSYSWGYGFLQDFIYVDYKIINLNETDTLHQAYVGFFVDGDVGRFTDPAAGEPHIWEDDFTWFDPDRMMAVIQDAPGGPDGDALSPLGIRIIQTPGDMSQLQMSFHWYRGEESPRTDRERYDTLSSGGIMPNQTPEEAMDTRFLFGFGPFEILPGDTLPLTVAVLCGDGLNDFLSNADWAESLYVWNFHVPLPPPPPKVTAYPEDRAVHLVWDDTPESYYDPWRLDGNNYPFEGYRVYKSTSGVGGPWTLIFECDRADNRWGFNVGLTHEFWDYGLPNCMPVYYSVTAFAAPDTVFQLEEFLESAVEQNIIEVLPGPPADTTGKEKVMIIPNPYRGDFDYTSIGWEYPRPGLAWTEEDRRIVFMNLPPHCKIRIYTLGGDLVREIEHNDPVVGWESWDLLSSEHQAIAPGIYIYSVENLDTGDVQVGKFVVIK